MYNINVNKERAYKGKGKKIMTNKKTQRDFYNELLANYDLTDELKEFINSRINALNKKATKTELTETQKENLVLANEIYEWLLENVNGKTSKDIANHFGKSSQKITPIMKKLIDDEKVSFTVEKKVKVFKAVSQD